jgi:F-type H+-transporting ATPase subunit b
VEHLLESLNEPETWVAIAFVIFVSALLYLRVHKTLAKSLDDRAGRIKAELDEAARLKNEAVALLAEYQRKRQETENEAQSIIAGAKAEAERLAVETKAKAEEFVARRTRMAEAKIAQAEAQAVADVRSAAADAAVAAAETILAQQAKGALAGDLIAKGIDDVSKKLN